MSKLNYREEVAQTMKEFHKATGIKTDIKLESYLVGMLSRVFGEKLHELVADAVITVTDQVVLTRADTDLIKAELTRRGYYTQTMWSDEDVKSKFGENIDPETIQKILNDALGNEWIVGEIHDSIRTAGDIHGFTEIEFYEEEE